MAIGNSIVLAWTLALVFVSAACSDDPPGSNNGDSANNPSSTNNANSTTSVNSTNSTNPQPCRCSGDTVCKTDTTDECVECNRNSDCGDLPYCDLTRNICYGCSDDSECQRGQTCDRDTGICGECFSSSDCPADRPICSENLRCETCRRHIQCEEANPDTPFCARDGSCGECGSRDEPVCLNKGQVCDVFSGTCKASLPGSPQSCQPCNADEACANGVCVELIEGSADWRCMPGGEQGFCPNVFTTQQRDVGTVDGNVEPFVCYLPETTTCDAYLAMINGEICSADSDCPEGGHCDATFCELRCSQDFDCRPDRECIDGQCIFSNP